MPNGDYIPFLNPLITLRKRQASMDLPFDTSTDLDALTRRAATRVAGFDATFEPEIRTAEPKFGDFQANGVLPFARRQRSNPRQLAESLMASMREEMLLSDGAVGIEIAGPGFINFRLNPEYLSRWLRIFKDESKYCAGARSNLNGRKIVLDFSSPNTAKQMHIGHLRATVMGEAIGRLLEFCGANLTRDNHIGDWGTQFGLLILAIKAEGYALDTANEKALEEIEELYRKGETLASANPEALEQARRERAMLQSGDPENLAIWDQITAISYASFEILYKRLGVRFDEVLGESFYRDRVNQVFTELTESGIATESEGALVVFHPEHKRFKRQPFIIRNSDGSSNYPSHDIATILYRVEHWETEEMIYVVDSRQNDHFEQLFLTADKWFRYRDLPLPKLRHIGFGTILGTDGKPIKTRTGAPPRVKDLLDEAEERALAIVSKKNPDLSEAEKRRVAAVVGLGAVKYSDLMQNRTSDYVFSWEKMLSFEGNTAPYLLYAVARIYSIFRKAGIQPGDGEARAGNFETDSELALARKLVAFPSVLDQTLGDLRPHFLCIYLYELAGHFSTFYNADRVLVDDASVKARRLLLCARTLSTLECGLHLLGLETLKRM